jgi:hypothetical protein
MQPTPLGKPLPLAPPEGSRPSVQTEAQQLFAQVQAATQAPLAAAVQVVPLARAASHPAPTSAVPVAVPVTTSAVPARAPAPHRPPGAPVPYALPVTPPRKKGLSKGGEIAIAIGLAAVIIVVIAVIVGALN